MDQKVRTEPSCSGRNRNRWKSPTFDQDGGHVGVDMYSSLRCTLKMFCVLPNTFIFFPILLKFTISDNKI